jgi:hypothetical protein
MESKKSDVQLRTDPIIEALKRSEKPIVAMDGFIEVERGVVRIYARPESSVYIEIDSGKVVHFISPKSEGMPTRLYLPEDTQMRYVATSIMSAAQMIEARRGMKASKGCSCSGKTAGAQINDNCHDQWWECVQGPLSIDMCNLLYDACEIISKFPDTLAPVSSY